MTLGMLLFYLFLKQFFLIKTQHDLISLNTTELGKETHINISIFDEVQKRSDKSMGSAAFKIGDILGTRGSIEAKKLKNGGTLTARIQKATPLSAGKLALRMQGIKLKNVEGMFKNRTRSMNCVVPTMGREEDHGNRCLDRSTLRII